jgi:hypothetical protein
MAKAASARAPKAVAVETTPAAVETTPAAVAKPARVKAVAAPVAPEPEPIAEVIPQIEQAGESLFEELLGAAKALKPDFPVQHASESDQSFFKRLAAEVSNLADESFDALTEEAQKWANDAVLAVNDARPLPVLEGYVAPSKPAIPSKPAAAAKAAKVAKGPSAPKVDGLAAYRAKKAADKANGVVAEPGRVTSIQHFVIDNPNATAAEISAHLTSLGLETKDSTISVTSNGTKNVLAYLREKGYLVAGR